MANGPIGTKKNRIQKALYWYWTKDITQEEIGEKLGVSRQKVSEYIHEGPTSDAIQEQLNDLETEVRYVAIQQLRDQLKQAGHRAQSAEKPVKIYKNESGQLVVKDQTDEEGEVVDRFAVPVDIRMGPDDKARFFGRQEAREIIDLLTDIVGAKAAERQQIEHSGNIDVDANHTIELDSETAQKIRDADLDV